ncbi:DUF4333 domain-containing protein [Mycobacterium sp.]|uniref:DUF4333 domain-containing protein n=1 Tax=Mycobacterium sp. TaxID=1785 RepID=UPI002C26536F|nr:DUF4333 domain-containing protein [Mycobacterium sp.]HKP43322.1 DUF4333 domain-containing protein [Mycobacterium sp.]
MSGPQGSDPTQPWPGQQPEPGKDQPSSEPSGNQAWQPPTSGAEQQPTAAAPAWQPPPAYDPQQQQYPQYQQPGQGVQQPAYQPPQYPPTEQFGQQPGAYNPQQYPGQYGQPQYGQQYGQQPDAQYGQQPGQYGQQPGQYGQYPQYAPPGAEEGSKRSLAVIGGVIGLFLAIIVAVVLVLGFWKPGWFVTTKLDVSAAQTGVQQILTDETNGYGAKNVKDVKCNQGDSPTVKKGGTFDCEVSIDGTKRKVTVTFQDDKGTYEVGRPK